MRFFEELKTAANDVNLELSEKQYEQFIKYMRLVQEWNEKINLTAITEDEEVIKKHFIDCIKAFKSEPIKKAKTIIDVGTGAGFPGLPIAIMNPNVEVTLLDSLNKRINFLIISLNSLILIYKLKLKIISPNVVLKNIILISLLRLLLTYVQPLLKTLYKGVFNIKKNKVLIKNKLLTLIKEEE